MNLESHIYLKTTKLLLFTKGHYQTPISNDPSSVSFQISLKKQSQSGFPPEVFRSCKPCSLKLLHILLAGKITYSASLNFLESEYSFSLWHSSCVSFVHAADTY